MALPEHRSYDTLHARNLVSRYSVERSMATTTRLYVRQSPPTQPGERELAVQLPSFHELIGQVRADSPPPTPSRRNDAIRCPPIGNRVNSEPSWEDHRHQRHDTLGESLTRPSHAVEPSTYVFQYQHNASDPSQLTYRDHHDHASFTVRSPGVRHSPFEPTPSQVPAGQLPYPYQSVATPALFPPPPPPGTGYDRRPSHPPYDHRPSHQHHDHRPSHQHRDRRPSHQGYDGRPGHQAYDRRPSHQQPRQSGMRSGSYDRAQDLPYNSSPYPVAPHPGPEHGRHGYRFQPNSGVDSNFNARKRRGNLPKEATNLLKEWYDANKSSPYPSEDQKIDFCQRTGLTMSQVSNWFINSRRRAPAREAKERERARGADSRNGNP